MLGCRAAREGGAERLGEPWGTKGAAVTSHA